MNRYTDKRFGFFNAFTTINRVKPKTLKPAEIAILSVIWGSINKNTQECFLSQETIKKCVNISSDDTYYKYYNHLLEEGWIVKKSRFNNTNTYRVEVPQKYLKLLLDSTYSPETSNTCSPETVEHQKLESPETVDTFSTEIGDTFSPETVELTDNITDNIIDNNRTVGSGHLEGDTATTPKTIKDLYTTINTKLPSNSSSHLFDEKKTRKRQHEQLDQIIESTTTRLGSETKAIDFIINYLESYHDDGTFSNNFQLLKFLEQDIDRAITNYKESLIVYVGGRTSKEFHNQVEAYQLGYDAEQDIVDFCNGFIDMEGNEIKHNEVTNITKAKKSEIIRRIPSALKDKYSFDECKRLDITEAQLKEIIHKNTTFAVDRSSTFKLSAIIAMGKYAEIEHLPKLLQDYILEQREKKDNKDAVKDVDTNTTNYSQEMVEVLKTPDMNCEDEEFDLEKLFGSYDI